MVEYAFPHMKFKLSDTTFILHHTVRFDRAKNCINMNGIRYANNYKPVMLISTCESLRTNFIDPSGLMTLQQIISATYPQENISTEKQGSDFYLATKTVMGAIFLYMMLDAYGIKAKFKKIPKDISGNTPKDNYVHYANDDDQDHY